MKKTNIIYWIFTGLAAAMMLLSSIPDIMNDPEAIKIVSTHMGYPKYFIPLIGWAKILGVIGILIPGFPRVKEWAYAGLVFDLLCAIASFIALGDPFADWVCMLLPLALVMCSYIYYHKRLKLQKAS